MRSAAISACARPTVVPSGSAVLHPRDGESNRVIDAIPPIDHHAMLRSYLTIAWRTLRKRAGTTAINVVGLAVGLAACLLIGLRVQHELSYDTFHPEADRICW